jgi:hypothetical protein
MHPRLTHIVAQEHIADLHRAADRNRLLHTATSNHAAAAPVRFLRWLRRRRAGPVPALAPPPPGLSAPVARDH